MVRLKLLTLLLLIIAPPAMAEEPWRLQTALSTPDWLAVSGSVRLRYETLENQFVAGRTGSDAMLATQSLLKLEAHRDDLAAGVEFIDVRRWIGDSGGGVANEIDALEPLQAYLSWRPKQVMGGDVDLTLGRFTLDLGSRRLAARANFRLPTQTYTGVRSVWNGSGGRRITGFYAAPATRLPSDTASALDNEIVLNRETGTRFGGLLIETPVAGLSADAYFYSLDEDDAPDIATRNRQLATYGLRLRRPPKTGAPDFELEYASQSGEARATTGAADTTGLKVDAHMAHAEAGYSFNAPWSLRLALQWDFATGDRDPTDARLERFDALFGDRRFDLGPTSTFSAVARTNFNSPALRLEVKPDAASEALIAWRAVRLESARDAFGNNNVRDPSGASGDDVGDQIEARYRRWLVKDSLRLDVGGAWIREGGFLRNAPNATRQGDPLFGYLELQWTF